MVLWGVFRDPAAASEVRVEDADEEDVLRSVLQELFGEWPLQPHITPLVLMHLHNLGFIGTVKSYQMKRYACSLTILANLLGVAAFRPTPL